MNIFLDFDGPVLDNKARLYQLYFDLLAEFGGNPLPIDEYWQLKRNCVKEDVILKEKSGFTEELNGDYQRLRIEQIESKRYLSLNAVINGCYESLDFLAKQGDLMLITSRRNRDNLIWELKDKKLEKYFKKILSDFNDYLPAWQLKVDLIREFIPEFGKADIIVGDTEAEILCAKELGIYSIALLSGIRNEEKLKLYVPDIIYENINEVVKNWTQIKTNAQKI
ncbi:MAG: HAD family hydrolase [Candidatus Omnitrophica bacterium]|nr:HAD family hydrolase [Candidatus Omnitrophota bacterium]